MATTTYIEDNEFQERFTMIEEDDDIVRFDTFNQLQIANIENPSTIWTATESDGKLYFESGIRRVNVVYYFLTKESVEDGVSYVVDCDCNDENLWA